MRPLTPESTVHEIAAAGHAARLTLRSKGIDPEALGLSTFARAAADQGLALEPTWAAVVAALPPDVRPAAVRPLADGPIRRSDSIRAVIARYPQAVAVFERAGLLGCGGTAGPDEPIDLFAAIHRLDAGKLLADLELATKLPAEAAPAAVADEGASTLYRRFLVAGLLSTVTLGATFGAYNLLVIHWALGPVLPWHQWVHGTFQLFGFVLPLLLGVSYHTVPRFLGAELAWTRVARATFWTGLSGLALVTYGCCGGWVPYSVPALAAGAGLQFMTVTGWAAVLAATFRRAKPAADLFHRFLAAGTLWWLVAAGFGVAGAVTAVRAGDANAAVEWHEALYTAALLGGTLAWIQGMFLRTGPVFLGLRVTRDRWVKASLPVGQLGVALAAAGAATLGESASPPLTDAGLLLVALSVVAFAIGVRPFSRETQSGHAMPGDTDFRWMVRLAFAWSLVFAAVAALYAGIELSGREPDRFLYDGARHALALGFITTMVFAMAGRIVPIFGGAELRWPVLRRVGALLIAAGVALRELQVVEALVREPRLLWLSGPSGVVAATGICLATASLLATLRSAALAQPAPTVNGTVELGPDENVYRLVTAHAEAIPILIEAGFTPLANPMLRKTLTRAVTLRQACKLKNIDLDAVLARLRAACPHEQPSQA